MVVILGDNVFEDDITQYVQNFVDQKQGAKILIQEVSDPQKNGVPELRNGRILSTEEKPAEPKSNYAVTGIYMFDSHVYEIVKSLKPSARGELEITDVNNAYIVRDELTYDILQGWWTDVGTHVSLAKADELAQSVVFGNEFGKLKL
ncbi:glucose-1-phosphate thymidylyltransferase [Paenibacillus sp. FSL H8-237]|nr:glucose-1-phosphate thymidylyltransferase [Paenibacillus sp. FSL H8-237]